MGGFDMKRRNVFLVLVMTICMLLSACGSAKADSLVGKWTGSLDLTNQIVQNMVAANSALEKHAQFENLQFSVVFYFTADEVKVHIDEASTQQFVANMKTGVGNTVDAMVAAAAAENNMTVEAVYAGMGVTRDSYVQSLIEAMQLEAMVKSIAESLELKGAYKADEETIVVLYEDDTYEEMKYALDGDKLTITISDGTNQYQIPCTKTK